MAKEYGVTHQFISGCYHGKNLYKSVKSKPWKNRRITYTGGNSEQFSERGPWCKKSVDKKRALISPLTIYTLSHALQGSSSLTTIRFVHFPIGVLTFNTTISNTASRTFFESLLWVRCYFTTFHA